MHLKYPQTKDISVIMPCLNECTTVGLCVDMARGFFERHHLNGEVIVVDNGSTDGSGEEAEHHGAIVIKEERRGYGSAIRKGLKSSCGKVIVIGDCDTTYDFSALEGFYYPIAEEKCDMVIGDRFSRRMEKGAMPLNHKIGVRFLSWLARFRFKTDVRDFHCGLRSISRDTLKEMSYGTTGMEFATEMIARASEAGLKIYQTPTKLSVCRFKRKSKLHAIRDGMRHLGYILNASM